MTDVERSTQAQDRDRKSIIDHKESIMQASANAARIAENDTPKTQKFSLRTPYMKQGRVTQLVAETPNLWIHTKINAEGGENEIHQHLDEDHSFIVLEGQMSVFDETGAELQVGES